MSKTDLFIFLLYLIIINIFIFSKTFLISFNYFSVDDKSWFYWAKNANIISVLKKFLEPIGVHPLYRPIQIIYFYISWKMFGPKPIFYHIISFLVYVFCVIFLFIFYLKITKNKLISLFSVIIFSTRIALNLAIFWISAIKETMSLLFALLSLIYFLKSNKSAKKNYFFSYLFLILSLFTNETEVVLPILISLFYIFNFKSDKKIFSNIWFWSYFILLIVFLVFRFFIVSGIYLPKSGLYEYKIGTHIFSNIKKYIIISFGSVFTQNSISGKINSFTSVMFIFSLLIMIKHTPSSKYKKILYLSFFWFFISLLPFLPLNNISNDYYLSLSLVGFSLLFGTSVYNMAIIYSGNYKIRRNIKLILFIFFFTIIINARNENYDYFVNSFVNYSNKAMYNCIENIKFFDFKDGEIILIVGDSKEFESINDKDAGLNLILEKNLKIYFQHNTKNQIIPDYILFYNSTKCSVIKFNSSNKVN